MLDEAPVKRGIGAVDRPLDQVENAPPNGDPFVQMDQTDTARPESTNLNRHGLAWRIPGRKQRAAMLSDECSFLASQPAKPGNEAAWQ